MIKMKRKSLAIAEIIAEVFSKAFDEKLEIKEYHSTS